MSKQLSRRLGLEHVCPADIASGFSDTAKQNRKEQTHQTRDGQEPLHELILERLKDASCEEKVELLAPVEGSDRPSRGGSSTVGRRTWSRQTG